MSDVSNVCVNSRVLAGHTTGVQRHLLEVLKRFPESIQTISPSSHVRGVVGHGWEQFVLPRRIRGRVLWSPANTGPLSVGRQVLTIHDIAPLDHPEWFSPRFAQWYGYLLPKLVRRVSVVLVVSEFTKDRVRDRLKVTDDRIQVVSCGVGERYHELDSSLGSWTPDDFGLGEFPGERYVLSLSSLEPRKNISRLLIAWERICGEVDERLWLVISGARGSGLVFKNAPEFEKLPPRVFLAGYVADENLPFLYANAQALIYPSLYEGFGLPPLEAMAVGTPVIAGNVASLPEVVGDAGILVDPLDVDALADGIIRMVKSGSLRAELSERARTRAQAFSWQRTADTTWRCLTAVAEC